MQWQAWLRHTRFEAPSVPELVQEQRRRMIIQERAKKLDQEWEQRKLQKQKEQEEAARLEEPGNQTGKKKKSNGCLSTYHLTLVSSSLLEQPTTSEPTGQGDTFVPGEWTPTNARR